MAITSCYFYSQGKIRKDFRGSSRLFLSILIGSKVSPHDSPKPCFPPWFSHPFLDFVHFFETFSTIIEGDPYKVKLLLV